MKGWINWQMKSSGVSVNIMRRVSAGAPVIRWKDEFDFVKLYFHIVYLQENFI